MWMKSQLGKQRDTLDEYNTKIQQFGDGVDASRRQLERTFE